MGQNGHANVLVMRKSKNTITVVKKAHTIKNLVLGGLHTRKVNYLSQTYAGKRHDKKIADEESPTYPEDISLYKDTGFQGYEPEGVKTFQPQKKPKGKELTSEQKEQNSLISSIRIVIEHIISGMKRCRIVKDLFRNTKAKYDDLVMEIDCVLQRYRVPRHARPEYAHSAAPRRGTAGGEGPQDWVSEPEFCDWRRGTPRCLRARPACARL